MNQGDSAQRGRRSPRQAARCREAWPRHNAVLGGLHFSVGAEGFEPPTAGV